MALPTPRDPGLLHLIVVRGGEVFVLRRRELGWGATSGVMRGLRSRSACRRWEDIE